MNNTAALAANPFALMMSPADVFSAIEESIELRRLRQQQYLLLDRPASAATSAALAAFDAQQDTVFEALHVIEEDPPISESVGASSNYQTFPRVFN